MKVAKELKKFIRGLPPDADSYGSYGLFLAKAEWLKLDRLVRAVEQHQKYADRGQVHAHANKELREALQALNAEQPVIGQIDSPAK